jgi:MFS family permease
MSTLEIAKITATAGIGGVIEYFDLFIAGFITVVVWPKIMFPSTFPSEISLAIALAASAITFITRPLGGFIFGHIADRTGRRQTLVFTMALMGLSMLGVSALPTFAQIGWAAPFLLYAFRGLYSVGLGGEFGGGSTWILEAASKSKWRPFFAVWVTPVQLGVFLSSGTVALLSSTLGPDLFTYGWRIPFVIGGTMVIVAFVARLKVIESPLFLAYREKVGVDKAPAWDALKKYWAQMLMLGTIFVALQAIPQGNIVNQYSLIFLGAHGVPAAVSSGSISIANILALGGFLIGPYFTERLGRKAVLQICIVWGLLATLVYIPLLSTLNPTYITLANALIGAEDGFSIGAVTTFFGEIFPIRYRASASGLSYNIGQGLVAGIQNTVIIPLALVYFGNIGSAWWIIASEVVALIFAFLFLTRFKETKHVDLAQ